MIIKREYGKFDAKIYNSAIQSGDRLKLFSKKAYSFDGVTFDE